MSGCRPATARKLTKTKLAPNSNFCAARSSEEGWFSGTPKTCFSRAGHAQPAPHIFPDCASFVQRLCASLSFSPSQNFRFPDFAQSRHCEQSCTSLPSRIKINALNEQQHADKK